MRVPCENSILLLLTSFYCDFRDMRFRFDEFIKFDEFVNRLLVVQTLQEVVFIVNDW